MTPPGTVRLDAPALPPSVNGRRIPGRTGFTPKRSLVREVGRQRQVGLAAPDRIHLTDCSDIAMRTARSCKCDELDSTKPPKSYRLPVSLDEAAGEVAANGQEDSRGGALKMTHRASGLDRVGLR